LNIFSGPSAFFHLVDHINPSMGNKDTENAGFTQAEPITKPQQQDSLVSAIMKSAQQASPSLRLLSSILLVGGTSKTPHLQTFLRAALSQAIHETALPTSDPVIIDYIPNTRDLDPSFVSWKGGAVASKLEGCQDSWIHADEWRDWGPKLFRERLPFTW
jgi:actin-related protein 8